MNASFYNTIKIPKIPIFVADKDDLIIYRNDTARVRFSTGNDGTSIIDLIDESDISRYRSLVGGYSGLDRKGVLRLNIGSKMETAIFEQHTADNVVLRAFMIISGDYSQLKKLYKMTYLEDHSIDKSMNALYHITENSSFVDDTTDSLAELYSQVFSAKLLLCSCFGHIQMNQNLMKAPCRFIGIIDFWVNHMLPKIHQIDCDMTAEYAPNISSSDYATINACALLAMMTALAAYLAEISIDRKIRLKAGKRSRTYSINISTHTDILSIAQYNPKICTLAEQMPSGCLNLVLASSISKQCGFALSYSVIGTVSKELIFHFNLNNSDVGTIGFKANNPGHLDSLYIDIAQILFC